MKGNRGWTAVEELSREAAAGDLGKEIAEWI